MEALRLCETVEIIGVLCLNPELASFDSAPMDEWGLGRDARTPSTALVPRLHALFVRRLPFYNPLLPFTPAWLSEDRLAQSFQTTFGQPGAVAACRAAAVAQLARHLGGDAVAAEYVLMLLVSRSFDKLADKALGAWGLNIAKWPAATLGDATSLCEALAAYVPRLARLEISADALNTQKWRPRKDFALNRLVAGRLQLAAGTLAVFDETRMAEGQVSAEGVKAVMAAQSLVNEQQLVCNFEAYDVNIPLEISSLLVSSGRSIVKDVEVVVPLRPTGVAESGRPWQASSR
jgi:hypothetical protein